MARIGSIVADSGGQKVQKEKERKEAAESEAKERDAVEDARQGETTRKTSGTADSDQTKAPAPSNAESPTQAQSPAPPAPVTSADIAPPSQNSAAPPTPTTSPLPQSAAAPAPAPASLPAPHTAIRFAPASIEIGVSAKAELDRFAERANDRGVQQIELRAYAGGADVVENRNTALARLLAVRSYLIDMGVKAQIEVRTFGAAPGDNDALQRVDLVAPGL